MLGRDWEGWKIVFKTFAVLPSQELLTINESACKEPITGTVCKSSLPHQDSGQKNVALCQVSERCPSEQKAAGCCTLLRRHKDVSLRNKVNHGLSLRTLKIVCVGICRAKAVNKSWKSEGELL